MNDQSRDVLANLLKWTENDAGETPAKKWSEKTDEILEFGDDFSFEGFQVVRREFFAHLREPSSTFNACKFSVNSACLAKFPDTEYVQALVNPETKMLALRPCEENDRDAFRWCNDSKGKKQGKAVTCKLFFAKIVSLMDWNPSYRYKLLGRLIHAAGEYLIAFDLTAAEVYQRTVEDGEKPKVSRIPVYPAAWQNQFGVPYNEHKQSMQVSIFDGYAVYSIRDDAGSKESKEDSAAESAENDAERSAMV